MSENAAVILRTAVLSGFEYSRPENKDLASEAGAPASSIDIYRRPGVQGDLPREKGRQHSRKTYDLYALGLLILGIEYWQPLRKIPKLNGYPDIGFEETEGIKKILLETKSEILEVLQEKIGEGYAGS